jgi:Tape measure protein
MTAKLQVQLEALVGNYFGDLTRAADKLQDFQEKATRAGVVLSAAFTVPLALFGRTAVKSGAELDGLFRSMTAIEGSAEKASARIKILNEIAKLPGLNFKDAVQGDVNLRSAGLSAELAAKSMSAFGNALGILGKQGGLGNVNAQIQQMATKTQGFGADLKILKEWVPQVSTALQSAFGTTNADMIEKMGNTGKEVIEKLVAELGKLPKATGGLGNSLENLDDSWFKFTGSIGLSIEKSIGLSGIIDKLSASLTDLAKWFEELDPVWQKTILGIAGVTAIIGPLLLGLAAIIPLFGSIGTAAGMLFSAPVLTAVAVVAAAFVTAKIATDIYQNGWDSFWNRLVDKADKSVRKINLSILKMLNFKGSTDFAIGQAELELAKSTHETDSHVSLGNESFAGRKPQPKVPKPVSPPSGIPKPIKGKEVNYYNDYIDDHALDAIKEAHEKIKKEDDSFFKSTAEKASAFTELWKKMNPYYEMTKGVKLLDVVPPKLDDFLSRVGASMANISKGTKSTLQILKEDMDGFFTDLLNENIRKGVVDMASGMAEWVGAFAVGVKSFKDLGNLLKGIFGDLMISTGKQMLTIAITTEAFKKAIKGLGAGAIPIAIGLIAAGSALKASSSKGASGGYQQVPQNSVGNYQPIYTPTNGSNGGTTQVNINLSQGQSMIRGNDLQTMATRTEYGTSRGF